WCNNDRHPSMHKIGGERGQLIVLSVSPAIVQGEVSTLEESSIIQALSDQCVERRVNGRRTGAKNSNHWHRWLLRPRRERPRRRAAEQRGKLAPSNAECHLIPPAGGAHGRIAPLSVPCTARLCRGEAVAGVTSRCPATAKNRHRLQALIHGRWLMIDGMVAG